VPESHRASELPEPLFTRPLASLLAPTCALGGRWQGLSAWQQGSLDSPFITRLLEPELRLAEGRALAQSRVGFVVQEEALPVADGLVGMVGQEKALEMEMSAGGDFELVLTVRPEGLEAARQACKLTVIGEVVEEGIWMEAGGERRRVEARVVRAQDRWVKSRSL